MDTDFRITRGECSVPTQEYGGHSYTLYPGEKYYSYAGKRLHIRVWEDANGPVPKGYHVHHKDGDRENNNLDNLCLVKASEHLKAHGRERFDTNKEWFEEFHKKGIEKAKDWHRSEEGSKWHREHAERSGFGKFEYGRAECAACGKSFTKRKSDAAYCSNSCKSAARRKSGVDDVERSCVQCGQIFKANKYVKTKFCSAECREKNRKGRAKTSSGV